MSLVSINHLTYIQAVWIGYRERRNEERRTLTDDQQRGLWTGPRLGLPDRSEGRPGYQQLLCNG